MKQEIPFSGYTEQPSDYDCPDGELSASVNLIHEDGALRPLFQPKDLFALEQKIVEHVTYQERLLCIHKTSKYEHYISVHHKDQHNPNCLFWRDKSDLTSPNAIGQVDLPGIKSVTSVGNTICVLARSGMHYFLWDDNDGENGGYRYLSSDVPEIKMNFGLNGHIMHLDCYNGGTVADPPTFETISAGGVDPTIAGWKSMTDYMIGKANKLVHDIYKEGCYCMPFFIRYAIRLFDGSFVHQSSPVLMLPSSTSSPCPMILCIPEGVGDGHHWLHLYWGMYAPACKIDMQLLNLDAIGWADYKDIIQSVDIFISRPIFTYKQEGGKDFDKFESKTSISSLYSAIGIYAFDDTIDDVYENESDIREMLKRHSRRSLYDAVASSGKQYLRLTDPSKSLLLPTKNTDDIREEFNSCSDFYLIHSIPFDGEEGEDILHWGSSNRKTLPTSEGDADPDVYSARERLSDDYHSHDTKVAEGTDSYNNRLILSNVGLSCNNGIYNQCFANSLLYGYLYDSESNRKFASSVSDYSKYHSGAGQGVQNRLFNIKAIFTHIRDGHRDIVVRQDFDVRQDFGELVTSSCNVPGLQNVLHYLFYPNPNAYKADIFVKRVVDNTVEGKLRKITVPLVKHDFLNGAYYFSNLAQNVLGDEGGIDVDVTADKIVSYPNKILVSEVDNPFSFPALGYVSVGSGSIIGIATAAQALSQGQFGAFPLYAFTTDGVWALAVSSTGTFSSVQPITRDVCINRDGILQLDGSVIFVTRRGVMHLVGSSVECISDSILTPVPFNGESLPYFEQLNQVSNHIPASSHLNLDTGAENLEFEIVPLLEYLEGCSLLYDYIHRHVVLFNPEKSYAYVFSTKSNKWGLMKSNISYNVNSYPDAIAVRLGVGAESDTVVSFSDTDETVSIGLFVTRPVSMGGNNMMKSLRNVFVRGYFNNVERNVGIVLYASNDLVNWFYLGSSRNAMLRNLHGTPYKYFRIAGLTSLSSDKSVSGATVEFDVEFANRIR